MNASIFRSSKVLNTIIRTNKRISPNILMNSSRVFSSKGDMFDAAYHLPYIKVLSPVCGLTKYSGIATGITSFFVAGLEFFSMIPGETTLAVVTAGSAITLLTAVTGQIFKNTIGYIYISDDDKNIKVAYINRWGSRVDEVMPVEDWVPISDLKKRKTDYFYYTAKQHSNPIKYKLFYKHGIKMLPQICEEIIEKSKTLKK